MTAKTDASESAKPKYRRASARKVRTGCKTCKIRHIKCDERRPHCRRCLIHGVICDGYAPIEPRISTKKRHQDKSTIEVFELDDSPPPTICYTPSQPPTLFQKQPQLPRRPQSVVVPEEHRHSAHPLSLEPPVAENPELELAPIQRQLPLRSEKKLPSIAELVQYTAISARSNQASLPRVNQTFSLPKLADYFIELAGTSRLISMDRSCHGIDYDGSVLLPRLHQPFGGSP